MNENYPIEVLDDDDDDGTMVRNVSDLRDEVVGHRIVNVEKARPPETDWGYRNDALAITLDNGKVVYLENTDDCCAITELQSFLWNAEKIDHVITGVGTTDGYQTWHIYADMGDVLAIQLEWSCGNPFYYGYGFNITVTDKPLDGE